MDQNPAPFFTPGRVILALMILVCCASAFRLVQYASEHRTPIVGDGQRVETYGFTLSPALINTEQIVAGGMAKDSQLSIDNPELWSPAEVEQYNIDIRGKYLVSSDLVIGVEINGENRAYPLRVLAWHEIVNDTLGGIPIAVTYNYLTDSAIVFDRRVDGEAIELGFSGLLYNSNSLYYDKHPDPGQQSLWSQMLGKAVTGPAAEAGHSLQVISCQRVSWSEWKQRHPETFVIKPDEAQIKKYQANAGGVYFGSDLLLYPVDPLPPETSDLKKKTPVVVFIHEGNHEAVPIPELIPGEESVDTLYVEQSVFGETIGFDYNRIPESVWIQTERDDIRYFHTFWFAWYAFKDQLTENL